MPANTGQRANRKLDSDVSVGVAHALLQAAESAGVPRSRLLRAVRIDAAELEEPEGRLSVNIVFRMCELAIELSGDPALGLHWGERNDGYAFDPVAHLMAHAPTLRAALESLVHFQRLFSDQPTLQIVEQGHRVVVRSASTFSSLGDSMLVQRFGAELFATGIFKGIRALGANIMPDRVSFAYPAPAYAAEYRRVFRGLERFDQSFTGIAFSAALMNARSPHKDEELHSKLRDAAAQRMMRLTNSMPYAQRTREALLRHGPSRRQTMTTIARSLGISARSLRRRLADEGVTFDSVAGETLAIVAQAMLAGTDLTIQETARALGFGYTSAFHRAFKRWTGITPSAFRAAQLSDSSKP